MGGEDQPQGLPQLLLVGGRDGVSITSKRLLDHGFQEGFFGGLTHGSLRYIRIELAPIAEKMEPRLRFLLIDGVTRQKTGGARWRPQPARARSQPVALDSSAAVPVGEGVRAR